MIVVCDVGICMACISAECFVTTGCDVYHVAAMVVCEADIRLCLVAPCERDSGVFEYMWDVLGSTSRVTS